VHALQPRVVVLNNGTRKGGWPDVMKSFYTSPRFEDLWQIHFSLLSGQEYAPPGVFTANLVDEQPSTMPWLRCRRPAPTRHRRPSTMDVPTG
jgi:hypothetical protein